MSLVNDMLRDLDARRRDAPTRGIRAEKLVPAQERSDKPRNRVLPASALAVALVILAGAAGLAVAVYMMNWSQQQSASPSRQFVESTPAMEDESDPSAASQQELRALAQRLEDLERQNRELRATAEGSEVSVAEVQIPVADNVTADREWQPRDWGQEQQVSDASVPAARAQPEPESQQAPQQAQSAEPPPLIRLPRELGFRDRDRLQVQRALELWSMSQYNEALHSLDVFTMDYPEAHQSRETLAKLLIQRGELATALQVAEIGLAISPNHAGYKKVKARVLMSEGLAREALDLLKDRPPSVRVDQEYHDLLAMSALTAGDFTTALSSYQQLLDQDEEQGRWWFGMATSLEAQGRVNQAVQAYERALRSGGLSAGLRQNSQQRLAVLRQST